MRHAKTRKRGASWAVKRAAAQRPAGQEGPARLTPAWEVGVGEGADAPTAGRSQLPTLCGLQGPPQRHAPGRKVTEGSEQTHSQVRMIRINRT